MKKTTEMETKEITAMQPTNAAMETISPTFVEAEKMFEKLTDITMETARRAFEFFRERGGEWGREVEDWFKAESEILRPVPVEIRESKDNLFVKAAVPDFKPDEIEVSVKDNMLIISGKTESRNEPDEEANTIVREWRSNRFFRQLTLPSPVLAEKVTAKLTNGMLELTLPKAAEHGATKVAVAAA
ncbi:MAG TPA: Hsp20 family protein [Pyrinomonadaceae bacterium]